jgi:hypothetical protein
MLFATTGKESTESLSDKDVRDTYRGSRHGSAAPVPLQKRDRLTPGPGERPPSPTLKAATQTERRLTPGPSVRPTRRRARRIGGPFACLERP